MEIRLSSAFPGNAVYLDLYNDTYLSRPDRDSFIGRFLSDASGVTTQTIRLMLGSGYWERIFGSYAAIAPVHIGLAHSIGVGFRESNGPLVCRRDQLVALAVLGETAEVGRCWEWWQLHRALDSAMRVETAFAALGHIEQAEESSVSPVSGTIDLMRAGVQRFELAQAAWTHARNLAAR